MKGDSISGGAVAIRGFLVQTLVALLEIVGADPPFIEIVLEPSCGNEQFDFIWKDVGGVHAIQVKSTSNHFSKADLYAWAAKLEAARKTEHLRLILLGNVGPDVSKTKRVGFVLVETRNLYPNDLVEQAAHRLATFLEAENQNPGTADEREIIVHALTSKLEHLSTTSTPLSREEFVRLLCRWIRDRSKPDAPINISAVELYCPLRLVGRKAELRRLNDAWDKALKGEPSRPRVLAVVAMGGEGKTSLVAKWAADLAYQGWPGCEAVFGWTFHSQGGRNQAASSDAFLASALEFFGDAELAVANRSAFEKGQRLGQIIGGRRALLILDGLEPLQYAPNSPTAGELRDSGMAAFLKTLAAKNCGLCIITTRCHIVDLRAYWGNAASIVELKRLSREAGVNLLKSFGVMGNHRREIPSADGKRRLNEFEKLVEDAHGHALTLNLLGSYLRDAHGGDIRKRDLVRFNEADAEKQDGRAFRVMDSYVNWLKRGNGRVEAKKNGPRELALLRLLGLFDRPATADCLAALLSTPAIAGLTDRLADLDAPQINLALTRLEDAKLVIVHRDAGTGAVLVLDAHPLVREYFADRMRKAQSRAWRAAHRRLYEHLCSTTKEGQSPTLSGLQPLYQAVAHGCQAGLQKEALVNLYRLRITRGEERYTSRKTGAFGSDLGALASFFERQWHAVSCKLPKREQAWLLNEAAFTLRALGRLTEALAPMTAGLTMGVRQRDWKEAARRAANLSELNLMLGKVTCAVSVARRAVTYADQSIDAFAVLFSRTSHADALHQAGCRSKARELFGEAERLQTDSGAEYKPLYLVKGFQYFDLQLAEIERIAWRVTMDGPAESTMGPSDRSPHEESTKAPPGRVAEVSPFDVLRVVSEYAARTVQWAAERNWLLDFALENLTLARCGLYRAILEGGASAPALVTGCKLPPRTHLATTTPHDLVAQFDSAVAGLRQAGQIHELPRGLLSRAWMQTLSGSRAGFASAEHDLNEAWEIAERGGMKLFLADIHLQRARLFFRESNYPWRSTQTDLQLAAKLINICNYRRRDKELTDARCTILRT